MRPSFSLIFMILMGASLVSCILAYSSQMMYQGDIKGFIVDFKNLKKHTILFKKKYDYYPGDFPNASTIWSECYNGNGDGKISMNEDEDFFDHLNKEYPDADISYTKDGIWISDLWNHRTDYGKIGGPIYGKKCHVFDNQKDVNCMYHYHHHPFSAQEASWVDYKIDDGIAHSGEIVGYGEECSGESGTPDYGDGSDPTDENACAIYIMLEDWFR